MSTPREKQTVQLIRSFGGWPEGARGVIVSVYSDSALVEMEHLPRFTGERTHLIQIKLSLLNQASCGCAEA